MVQVLHVGARLRIDLFCFCLTSILFKKLSAEYQWIFGFILPLTRELNILLLNKILNKVGNMDDIESKVATITSINVNHAMYISVMLGTSSTQETAYCILGIDFLLNILSSLKIVRLCQKIKPVLNTTTKNKKEKEKDLELLTLTLVEIIEILVPLAYTVVTVIAYNGPNVEIIGNMGRSIWQFEEIENVDHLVFVASEMFVVDFLSAIFAGLFLWKFCSINFLGEIYYVMCSYWNCIALEVSHQLIAVSLKYIPFS